MGVRATSARGNIAQSSLGREQVELGAFGSAEDAAVAYDCCANDFIDGDAAPEFSTRNFKRQSALPRKLWEAISPPAAAPFHRVGDGFQASVGDLSDENALLQKPSRPLAASAG